MTEVQFGTSVIGETLRRHITLTNNGALGTRLMFGKYTGKDHHIITAQPSEFVPRVGLPVYLFTCIVSIERLCFIFQQASTQQSKYTCTK